MSSILISKSITSQALETLCSKHTVVYEPELYKDRSALIAATQNAEILIGASQLRVAGRLRSGHIGGAAIDVFSIEPAQDLSYFSGIENPILTPHISGVTKESNERVSQIIANEINLFLEVQK